MPTRRWSIADRCAATRTTSTCSLAESAEATFLVSGDKDILAVADGLVTIRTAREAVDALAYRHPWTEHAVPAGEAEIWRRTVAEGNDLVIQASITVAQAVLTADLKLLAKTTTPESFPRWAAGLAAAAALLAGRGWTSRPEYPAANVAYVKWVPDSGDNIMITAEMAVDDVVMMTMVRRPDLVDDLGLGGWRAHQVGPPAALAEG